MEKIKVFIIEDNSDCIQLISYFAGGQQDISIVDTASSKEEALKKAFTKTYDIVVINVNLCGKEYDGIYIASKILQKTKTKILMITPFDDEKVIIECFKAGAVECIKKSEFKILPDVIRSVFNRRTPIEVLIKDFLFLSQENLLKDLTPSEKELFELRKQGFSIKNISEKVNKTERTLKNQSGNILKKLGVNSFCEALVKIDYNGIANLKQ